MCYGYELWYTIQYHLQRKYYQEYVYGTYTRKVEEIRKKGRQAGEKKGTANFKYFRVVVESKEARNWKGVAHFGFGFGPP